MEADFILHVTDEQESISLAYAEGSLKPEQEKTATPSYTQAVVVTPDEGKTLSKVTVEQIPDPTDDINITTNGDHDVRQKRTAHVNVPQGVIPTGTKTITENVENEDVSAYEAVNVRVPQPSGKITITENDTDVDIAQYAAADIAVPQGVFPQGTYRITSPGEYDVTNYATANVDIGRFVRDPDAPNLDLLRQTGRELAHGSGYNVAFASFYVTEKWAEGTFARFSAAGLNDIKEVAINSDGTWTAAADQPTVNNKYLYATATWPAVGWHCLRFEYNANVKQSLAAYGSSGQVMIGNMIYEAYLHMPGLQKEGYIQIVGVHCVVIDAAPAANADWSSLFNARKLSVIEFDHCDTSNVTNMSSMFSSSLLQMADLSSFNTSSVTNMSNMFSGCPSLQSVDLSSFNTANVTTMQNMFSNCYSLQTADLSSFNTSSVTTMQNMFSNCNSLIGVSFGDKQTHQFPKTGTAVNTWTADNETDSANVSNIFNGPYALQHIAHFIALDKSCTVNQSTLTVDSLMEIINELETVSTTQTLTIGATNIAKLDEDQLAIAQDKGWTVT